ncbi:hypothetical protein PR048_025265 [Dryococelus australis]|uniref:CHK kinase-like domain-containing protein n=1 Tax=Dryococelus australis TaxID=614101 RepID=A0ABQ9GQZ1_9NEOP|nr:hypothetical protein PR048_025265 [Dryococelus australis]
MAEIANDLTKKDLDELLKPTLDAEGTKLKDFSVRYLTKPGDNYGSTMLAVDVNLTPGPRTLPLVAKMLPKSAALQEEFQVEKSVRKEIDMYLLVRPALERIQKEYNVPGDKYLDVLPLCYGARISSKGDSGPVDATSVILQENLKAKGFETGDRLTGLNLEHCKLVVDKLARFHATTVSIKLKKPEEFKKTVLRAATDLIMTEDELNGVKPLENIPEYETMNERINTAILKSWELFAKINSEPPREPFATIAHLDLWTNNIMFQYESSSSKVSPKTLRFIDFQITQYDSPVRDLLFFLYTSAHLDVLSEHYDYLTRLYYDSFVDSLRMLDCETSPFSFDEFLKEIEYASSVEFVHIAFMLPFITISSEDAINTADMTHEDIKSPPKYGESYIPRARKFIQDFASRNWI